MYFFYLIELYLNVWNLKINFIWLKTLNSYEIWKAQSASFFFHFFSELVSLWLSASQNAARQRVKIDRVLGVEGGQIQHGGSLVGNLFVLRKFVLNINK